MTTTTTKLENVKLLVMHSGRNLRQHILEYLSKASYCFGCIAWCTDFDILDAMAARKGAHIVIQNDKMATRNYKHDTFRVRLREKYRRLPKMDWAGWEKVFWSGIPDLPADLQRPSHLLSGDNCSVRYAGCRQTREAKEQAREDGQVSMMHHKFLLYADERGRVYGVSFGSFNFTRNASDSDEDLHYIEDPRVVQTFFTRYLQVLQHSTALRL